MRNLDIFGAAHLYQYGGNFDLYVKFEQKVSWFKKILHDFPIVTL